MGFSAIIPADDTPQANADLDAAGFGPENFSVPLWTVGAPVEDAPTHVGLNSGADNSGFRAAIEAVPGVSVRAAPIGTVEFDEHAASLGLTREPSA